MSILDFTIVNRRLEEERRKQYRGTASVCLTSLQYQEKNPQAMKTIFLQERGCRKEDHRHHVRAIISQHDLEAAMLSSSISREMLMADTLPYPRLEFPPGFKIECIEGHDRLAAANEVLQGSKKRWIVDLYLDNLSNDLRMLLADGYDYKKIPDDGEIYTKIRQFQGLHGDINPFFENLWLARLAANANKWRVYNQLTKHKKFSAAFDKLLDIPGLFGGFRLSVIHQLLGMKCDEPNLAYLNHIYRWWSDIFEGDKAAMQQVTRDTVAALQGMAPGACSTDHETLLGKMKSGRIFENFHDQQREELWERVCSTSRFCLIPSLFTFFEDRKFLSDAAGAVRKVLQLSRKDTIAGCLEEIFSDHNQEKDKCIIQVSETTFAYIVGDSDTRLDLGIRQIWLAAFRNCREMPAETQKEDVLALSRTKTDKFALYELASLASRLGFESDKLNELSRKSIDQEIAATALLNARKPGRYEFHNRNECIQQMVSIFESAVPVSVDEIVGTALKTIRENNQPPNRYGRPTNADYEYDKTRLFLPHMRDGVNVEMGEMTSTFIRWSVYSAYFGPPPSLGTIRTEDDSAMLGVEFGQSQESKIPQAGIWSMLKSKEESTFEITGQELASYYTTHNVHDLEMKLEQLKKNLETEDQRLKEVVNEIAKNDSLLNEQKQAIGNEQARLIELQEKSAVKQKELDEKEKFLIKQQSKAAKMNADFHVSKGVRGKKNRALLNQANHELQEKSANRKRLAEGDTISADKQIQVGELKLQESLELAWKIESEGWESKFEAEKAAAKQEWMIKFEAEKNDLEQTMNNEHQSKLADLQAEKLRLEQELANAKEYNKSLIQADVEKINQLQNSIKTTEETLKIKDLELKNLRQDVNLTSSQLKENNAKKEQDDKEFNQIKREIENKREELKKVKREKEEKNEELKQIEQDIENKRAELNKVEKEKEKKDEELERIQKEVEEKRQNLEGQQPLGERISAEEEAREKRRKRRRLQDEHMPSTPESRGEIPKTPGRETP